MPSNTHKFWKFESTGNDFIMIDNRKEFLSMTTDEIAFLCHRKLGVGADGLILLESHPDLDFRMRYFNSDGQEASFCGNGGRAICGLAKMLRMPGRELSFEAFDGVHHAEIKPLTHFLWVVNLSMQDVVTDDGQIINTGSPHHIIYVDNLANLDVRAEGSKIRHSRQFTPEGCNVNFIEISDQNIYIRTYERGVEDETLSCGTGVTASAIFHHIAADDGKYTTQINTRGGMLEVSFIKTGKLYTDIRLKGLTRCVIKGDYFAA